MSSEVNFMPSSRVPERLVDHIANECYTRLEPYMYLGRFRLPEGVTNLRQFICTKIGVTDLAVDKCHKIKECLNQSARSVLFARYPRTQELQHRMLASSLAYIDRSDEPAEDEVYLSNWKHMSFRRAYLDQSFCQYVWCAFHEWGMDTSLFFEICLLIRPLINIKHGFQFVDLGEFGAYRVTRWADQLIAVRPPLHMVLTCTPYLEPAETTERPLIHWYEPDDTEIDFEDQRLRF